ncbi:MAG TPA: TIGR04190 family B12-binding domain/radical SAM domain protein [Acidimicrobiia bacterium]|nr:TIGR04190 family B12-binding domain/radical SAM domain protein [Acidimicrobiia bacterium]
MTGCRTEHGSTRPRLHRGARAVFGLDLVLVHAPSVFDFRDQVILQGPVADVVPSTDEFEMYPIGMTSIAGYLERHNYNVRIVNLGYRMLRSRSFDPEHHLRRLHAPVFGVDLHWLPHSQGALAVAELIKRVHPESAVLIGGMSASYFYDELIRSPAVDFMLRGDSTEEPCRQLLAALRTGESLETVPNLVWKRPDGTVVINPLSFVPADLDWVDEPDYRYVLRSVVKYWKLSDVLPYLEWLRQPTTLLLNARGCTYDCATCGGSRSAYAAVCNRRRPAFRSPENLIYDLRVIRSFSRSPVFMVHDPRLGGVPRARRFFDLLSAEVIPNELVIELFYPADDDFFQMVSDATTAWSMEITIESHIERIRRLNGKFPASNAKVEATLASALAHGCRKLDLFFMVGLPNQTPADALATVDYCAHLVDRFGADPRLQFYVAPLGPFLDPASRAYEQPALGYRPRFRTLAEHSRALLEPSWKDILSYETNTMSRDEIVETSYAVAAGLNDLKYRHRLIDAHTHSVVAAHLADGREVLAAFDAAKELPAGERRAILDDLRDKVEMANRATLCGSQELTWNASTGLRISRALLIGLAQALPRELTRGFARLLGIYDTGPKPAAPDPERTFLTIAASGQTAKSETAVHGVEA